MLQYEEFKDKITKMAEPKKSLMLSMYKDLQRIETKLDRLDGAKEYIINEKDPTQQVVLPIHKVIHDLQAQKNDIITKILRGLDGETGEESALLKALDKVVNG